MNEDNFHHFSAIRIGDRLVYNGVNGDAFSFGETPAKSTANNVSSSQPVFTLANGSSPPPPDTTGISSKQVQLKSVPVATDADAKSSLPSTLKQQQQQQELHYLTLTDLALNYQQRPSPQSSPVGSSEIASPLLPSSPLSSAALGLPPALSPPSAAALGLPPVLPPPPSAHLPPPLPSRPPSAAPSRSSSLTSLLSLKIDDRSRQSSPPSSPDVKSVNSDETHLTYYYLPSLFFRSSGTIKVEAPSRDHQPHHPPTSPSPPPLPLPTIALSSLLTASAAISLKSAVFEPTHPLVTTPLNQPTPGQSPATTTSAETSPTDSGEENGEEEVDNVPRPLAGQSDYVQTPSNTSLSSEKSGELVQNKDLGGWLFQKTLQKSTTEHNDVNRNIIPPEFDSLRKRSISYADVITSALVFYKYSKGKKKKIPYVQPKLEKASRCRKCGRSFGVLCFRYHCSRCKKSFCEKCIPILRYDDTEHETKATSSLTRVCVLCSEEITQESSKGQYRGLWTEFQKYRSEKRANRGLDVTSSTLHKPLESLKMVDVTPGLRSLCLRFLVEVHLQLEKQPRHKFLANYLHFENPAQTRMKNFLAHCLHLETRGPTKTKGKFKGKECHACGRQLRMMTDIRDCDMCEQTFCMLCTYRTLQLYLPAGTDLQNDVRIEAVKFHVKANEQDEVQTTEASEVYRVCAVCEDIVLRNLRVLEFDQKIPELEAQMFDLQRQVDHALTFEPHMFGLQRSFSASSLNHLTDTDAMTANIRLANRLYERYLRAYEILARMEPQTNGQKSLHKHIKQAMYDFYLKRRDQLKRSTQHDHDFCSSVGEME